MKRSAIALSIIVTLSLIPATTLSHPKKGGHTDHKTGFYHTHRDNDFKTEYNFKNDAQIQGAKVIRVIDGDTIEIELGSLKQRVRYIGIDTPEKDKPFYEEAKEYNEDMVKGRLVTLKIGVQMWDFYGWR